MEPTTLTLRTLTEDDLEAYVGALHTAFLNDPHPEDTAHTRTVYEPARSHGVFAQDRIVGTAGILTRDITLPGRRPTPVAAVTAVSVLPDCRRQGILTWLMRTQLHGLHQAGAESFAALWASEASIYGRFGYGLASGYGELNLPTGAAFRPGVQLGVDRVRELGLAEARPLLADIYQKVAPSRLGWLSRGEGTWDYLLRDSDHLKPSGFGARRFVVTPDGYAYYRVKDGSDDRGQASTLFVREVLAGTPQAYAAIWRYLLDMDLVASIDAYGGPDEPLLHLLANQDLAVRKHHGALWIRIVDLDRALTSRTYQRPLTLNLAITDELCPWNAGTWQLRVDSTGNAEVTATSAAPDIAMNIDDLGAIFLGGTRLSTLHAAGRATEHTHGAIRAASNAFLAEEEPSCIEVF